METVTILGEEYDVATTTSLDLGNWKITDKQLKEIAPELEKLVNLTVLYLDENEISDITPLARLTNLTKLFLEDNQISDITPLEHLTNLEHLSLPIYEISNEDKEWLTNQLPNCNIEFWC